MSNALMIKDMVVRLGMFCLIVDNFFVKKGVITGLIGRNGAGKTTLIKTIMDVIRPERGAILFDGKPMSGYEEEIKTKIAVVYDTPMYPRHLTAKQLADLVMPFYPLFDKGKLYGLLQRFQIHPHMQLGSCSQGMRVKFSMAFALAQNPELLFLDEPTAGLDPAARNDLLDLMLEFMQDESRTIFFSTHVTSDLDKVADYITLIDNGRIVFNEVKEELLDRYALIQVERNAMTHEIQRCLTGLRMNAFGYMGLCADRQALEGVPGISMARPMVEDIMIYKGGL